MEGYTIKQLINENEKLNNENINCYIAGFFDGEGSIEIGKSYVLKVRFTITHYSILSKIQKLYGGQIYKIDMKKNIQAAKNRGKEYKSTPKQVWQWTLHSYDTLKFMKSILPYLDEKKMQILLGIEYQEGKKSYRGWEGTPQLEIDRCEWFRNELQKLKHILVTDNEIKKIEKEINERKQLIETKTDIGQRKLEF